VIAAGDESPFELDDRVVDIQGRARLVELLEQVGEQPFDLLAAAEDPQIRDHDRVVDVVDHDLVEVLVGERFEVVIQRGFGVAHGSLRVRLFEDVHNSSSGGTGGV